MHLTKKDFTYHLPSELIAHTPTEPRDQSRLLIFDAQQGQTISTHTHFSDLPHFLREKKSEFVLVRNNSRVIPARIYGQKTTGGQVEILLVEKKSHSHLNQNKNSASATETWSCLTKPGLKAGQKIEFKGHPLYAYCTHENGYTRDLEFQFPTHYHDQTFNFADWMNLIGFTPLPPYIENHQSETELREIYQTLYASQAGSVAAPTAGLHFTPALDQALLNQGVEIVEVTLHVGLGTFLTVKETDIEKHHMHHEQFTLSPESAAQLNAARAAGKQIIAVGTTTTRVLESCAHPNPHFDPTRPSSPINLPFFLQAQSGSTDIFIYPPYQFRCVDHLITNFHLPESTLLMLISALTSSPNTPHPFTTFLDSPIGQAYQTAIATNYRFFSFGDAMLVW